MILRLGIVVLVVWIVGCSIKEPGADQTATVTDPRPVFADSESDALAGRGREHIVKGCVVKIIKLTDRGARVELLTCPDSPSMAPLAKWPPGTTVGWVAKSALDL